MGSKKKASKTKKSGGFNVPLLKLREGCVYVRRDGILTEPLEAVLHLLGLRRTYYKDPAHGHTYFASGRLFGAMPGSKHDLVALHTPPASEPHVYGYPKPKGFDQAFEDVQAELLKAQMWPAMNSAHEGWGILREEMLELEDELRLNQKNKDRPDHIKREAIQVAAMAIRLIIDCCTPGGNGYGK